MAALLRCIAVVSDAWARSPSKAHEWPMGLGSEWVLKKWCEDFKWEMMVGWWLCNNIHIDDYVTTSIFYRHFCFVLNIQAYPSGASIPFIWKCPTVLWDLAPAHLAHGTMCSAQLSTFGWLEIDGLHWTQRDVQVRRWMRSQVSAEMVSWQLFIDG